MKKAFYLSTFATFVLLLFYTLNHIDRQIVVNEENISKHFFNTHPEEFITINQTPDYTYEANIDARQINYTQSVRVLLKALNVSNKDIKAIAKLLDIDNTIVQQKSFIRMLYRDNIDTHPKNDIMPPYIDKDGFVRDIKYMSFPVNNTRFVLKKDNGNISLTKHKVTTKREAVYKKGKIEGSLYDAFITENIPHEVFQTFVNIYSFDVDFQRDIRKNDTFEIVYDTIINDEDLQEGLGRVLYVKLNLKTKKGSLEYFILRRTGRKEYYDRQGRAVSKTFMKTPINGARISSRYGYRKHPILGYSKLHTGTDFAAPSGTAIYAAADGIITFIGWNGGRRKGYGRYTKIRHNNTYTTAYAHQSRFQKGLRKGSRVRQGQVIGYVGSTGYSTGAHLHYEVIKNGKKINPSSVTSLSKNILKGRDKATLFANMKLIDNIIKKTNQQTAE